MLDKNQDYLGERIPLGPDSKTPTPPLKPLRDAAAPLRPIAAGASGDDESPARIQTFESQSTLQTAKTMHFNRPLNKTGQGATRVKTFHAKLGEKSLEFLDEQINEWLDHNPDVEVKFTTMTMGIFEAKRPENHLIISVWY